MTQNAKFLMTLASLGSVALVGGAWIFQWLGYAPCHLCYLQRNPHYAAIVIGAVALVTGWAKLAWAGAAAALATMGIGIYHSGVERDWWEGPTSCTSSGVGGLSADDLMDQILNAPLIQCDQISWQFLGLTMANYNAIFSAIIAVVWIMAAVKKTA